MNNTGMLTINMIRFMVSFRSVQILIACSILMTVLFAAGTTIVDGFGSGAILTLLGSDFPIPFMAISITYGSVVMVATLFIVLITFQFSEFLMYGHISQSVLGRHPNRLEVIMAYFLGILAISLPIGLIFIAYYFSIASSSTITLAVIGMSWMYTFLLILMSSMILILNATRKFALILMILVYFILPITFQSFSAVLSKQDGILSYVSIIPEQLFLFLGLHVQLSNLLSFTIRSSFLNFSELIEPIMYLIPYLVITAVLFVRKDMN